MGRTYQVSIQLRGMQRFVTCECGAALAMFGLLDLEQHLLEHQAADQAALAASAIASRET